MIYIFIALGFGTGHILSAAFGAITWETSIERCFFQSLAILFCFIFSRKG